MAAQGLQEWAARFVHAEPSGTSSNTSQPSMADAGHLDEDISNTSDAYSDTSSVRPPWWTSVDEEDQETPFNTGEQEAPDSACMHGGDAGNLDEDVPDTLDAFTDTSACFYSSMDVDEEDQEVPFSTGEQEALVSASMHGDDADCADNETYEEEDFEERRRRAYLAEMAGGTEVPFPPMPFAW